MITHTHVNDIMNDRFKSIFVVKKYLMTFVLAMHTNEKQSYACFVSLKFNREVHKSHKETHGSWSWQVFETLSRALNNKDEVIEFKNELDFMKWYRTEKYLDEILPKKYWVVK